jgi:hypothetical protein
MNKDDINTIHGFISVIMIRLANSPRCITMIWRSDHRRVFELFLNYRLNYGLRRHVNVGIASPRAINMPQS